MSRTRRQKGRVHQESGKGAVQGEGEVVPPEVRKRREEAGREAGGDAGGETKSLPYVPGGERGVRGTGLQRGPGRRTTLRALGRPRRLHQVRWFARAEAGLGRSHTPAIQGGHKGPTKALSRGPSKKDIIREGKETGGGSEDASQSKSSYDEAGWTSSGNSQEASWTSSGHPQKAVQARRCCTSP